MIYSGYDVGAVSDRRYSYFKDTQSQLLQAQNLMESVRLGSQKWKDFGFDTTAGSANTYVFIADSTVQ
jgi:hypothetical protein